MSFQNFLTEESNEQKLTHLAHPGDHVIDAKGAGVAHALNTLREVHKTLQGKPSKAKIATKYDGSPSLVFGHHPETGKFFVASKSAFNKNPKLNYTRKDIEENHGHAPGLVEKLHQALKHLPKVTPKHGVFQGDVMQTHGDVQEHGEHLHMTPNTITYSAHKDSPHGKVMSRAKVSVAVHTKYEGSDLQNMKAKYNYKPTEFGSHPDAHVIDTETK